MDEPSRADGDGGGCGPGAGRRGDCDVRRGAALAAPIRLSDRRPRTGPTRPRPAESETASETESETKSETDTRWHTKITAKRVAHDHQPEESRRLGAVDGVGR